MSKNSTEQVVNQATLNGGIIYVNNVRVYIDNPNNFDVLDSASGFWIRNAMGWKVYFKCPTREKAQATCNELYGKGSYTVNSKI